MMTAFYYYKNSFRRTGLVASCVGYETYVNMIVDPSMRWEDFYHIDETKYGRASGILL
jgi:hypothetical protein